MNLTFFKVKPDVQYDLIKQEEASCKDSILSFENQNPRKDHRLKAWHAAPWMASTLFFASLSLLLVLQSRYQGKFGTFKGGFATDLRASHSEFETHQVRFTGTPGFRDDGTEYMPHREGQPVYVGPPSKEVDEAWNHLTAGRYFLLEEGEAREAWGDDLTDFWDKRRGGYVAGVDMLHTLHCLNHIRMAFYPEHYPQPPIHGQMHRDHCIDHLRQMVQCYGDMTPIPTRFHAGIDQTYIDSDQQHTCRNFDKLRTWTTQRFNGSLAVPARHREDFF